MIHNFKYAFKILRNNKMLIFWTFAFPIILATFFNMAFQGIEDNEKLDIIPIAIIDNDEFKNNELYKETFKFLSDEENEDRLFETKYTSQSEAEKLLNNDEISGYLNLEKEAQIVVKKNGINQTIFKVVVEEIREKEDILNNIINQKLAENVVQDQSWYYALNQEVLKIMNDYEANIVNISSNNLSYTMIEYYTLIAMVCLYGGILGSFSVNQILANMSSNGKRVSISPTKKSKLLISSMFASFLTQLIGLALLFLYTIFILNVNYGNNLLLIILLAVVGSFAGLTLGIMITCCFKTNENTKTGIIIAVTMFGCFLSGMMGITMKYIVDKNIPFLNKINPASMITDGFYSLYYYDTLDRYYFNIISLLIFSLIMLLIASFSLRRQKYDSI